MLDENMLNCWIEIEISLNNREVFRIQDKLDKLGFDTRKYNKKLYFSQSFMRIGLGTSLKGALDIVEKVKELDLQKFELIIDCYEPSGYVKFIYTSDKLKNITLRSGCHPEFIEFVENLRGRMYERT